VIPLQGTCCAHWAAHHKKLKANRKADLFQGLLGPLYDLADALPNGRLRDQGPHTREGGRHLVQLSAGAQQASCTRFFPRRDPTTVSDTQN